MRSSRRHQQSHITSIPPNKWSVNLEKSYIGRLEDKYVELSQLISNSRDSRPELDDQIVKYAKKLVNSYVVTRRKKNSQYVVWNTTTKRSLSPRSRPSSAPSFHANKSRNTAPRTGWTDGNMTRSYSGGQNANEQQYLQEETDDEDIEIMSETSELRPPSVQLVEVDEADENKSKHVTFKAEVNKRYLTDWNKERYVEVLSNNIFDEKSPENIYIRNKSENESSVPIQPSSHNFFEEKENSSNDPPKNSVGSLRRPRSSTRQSINEQILLSALVQLPIPKITTSASERYLSRSLERRQASLTRSDSSLNSTSDGGRVQRWLQEKDRIISRKKKEQKRRDAEQKMKDEEKQLEKRQHDEDAKKKVKIWMREQKTRERLLKEREKSWKAYENARLVNVATLNCTSRMNSYVTRSNLVEFKSKEIVPSQNSSTLPNFSFSSNNYSNFERGKYPSKNENLKSSGKKPTCGDMLVVFQSQNPSQGCMQTNSTGDKYNDDDSINRNKDSLQTSKKTSIKRLTTKRLEPQGSEESEEMKKVHDADVESITRIGGEKTGSEKTAEQTFSDQVDVKPEKNDANVRVSRSRKNKTVKGEIDNSMALSSRSFEKRSRKSSGSEIGEKNNEESSSNVGDQENSSRTSSKEVIGFGENSDSNLNYGMEERSSKEEMNDHFENHVESVHDNHVESKQDNNVESKQDNHVESKQDNHVESKQDNRVESKQDNRVESKQDNHVESKQDNHVESKQDNNVESKQDNHVESKQDNRVESKQDNHVESKQDNHVESKQDNNVESKQDNHVESKQDNHVESKQDNNVESKQDNNVESKQDNHVESKQDNRVESKQGNHVESKQGNHVESNAEDIKEVEKKYSDHFDKEVHSVEKNKDGGSRDEEKDETQQDGDHKIVNSDDAVGFQQNINKMVESGEENKTCFSKVNDDNCNNVENNGRKSKDNVMLNFQQNSTNSHGNLSDVHARNDQESSDEMSKESETLHHQVNSNISENMDGKKEIDKNQRNVDDSDDKGLIGEKTEIKEKEQEMSSQHDENPGKSVIKSNDVDDGKDANGRGEVDNEASGDRAGLNKEKKEEDEGRWEDFFD